MTRRTLSMTNRPAAATMSGGARNGSMSAAEREWMTAVTAHRQIRCRLLPGKASACRRPDRTLEDQRQLYSAALEERIDCYARTGKTLTYQDQCRALTVCRQEISEMRACPTAIQRGTLKRPDEAYRAFFRRMKEGKGKGESGLPEIQGTAAVRQPVRRFRGQG